MDLKPGLRASVEADVGRSDTAVALGSGDVEVLGTPAVVALCEAAAVKAIAGALEPGRTSVGVHIDIEHLAPTPVGSTVVAGAELIAVEGRTLRFDVRASDRTSEIARGTHSRVVVGAARFMDGARSR
jgi:predicted thioesterase